MSYRSPFDKFYKNTFADFYTSGGSVPNAPLNDYDDMWSSDNELLEYPRNTIQSTTKKLNRLGIEEEKPEDYKEEKGLARKGFSTALDVLGAVSSPIDALGGVAEDLGKKFSADNVKAGKDISGITFGDIAKNYVKSIGSSFGKVFTEDIEKERKLEENERTFSGALFNAKQEAKERGDKNNALSLIDRGLGNALSLGVLDGDKAEGLGNIASSMIVDGGLTSKAEFTDVGKALAYQKNLRKSGSILEDAKKIDLNTSKEALRKVSTDKVEELARRSTEDFIKNKNLNTSEEGFGGLVDELSNKRVLDLEDEYNVAIDNVKYKMSKGEYNTKQAKKVFDNIEESKKSKLKELEGEIKVIRDNASNYDDIARRDLFEEVYEGANNRNIKSAEKSFTSSDEFNSGAEALMKKTKDYLGDYNFDGVKLYGKTIVGKDKLAKLAQKNSTYYASQIGLTMANPFSQAYALGKDSTKQAVKNLGNLEYAENSLGQLRKLRDIGLADIYKKFGDTSKIGSMETSLKTGEGMAENIAGNKKLYNIEKEVFEAQEKRLEETDNAFEETRKGVTDEQAKRTQEEVRRTIETPTSLEDEKYFEDVSEQKIPTPEYAQEVSTRVKELKKELNNRTLNANEKMNIQRQIDNLTEYEGKIEDMVGKETLDFRKKISDSLDETNLDYMTKEKIKNFKINIDGKEVDLSDNISYFMEKTPEQIAKVLYNNVPNLSQKELVDVAYRIKASAESVFRKLDETYVSVNKSKFKVKDMDIKEQIDNYPNSSIGDNVTKKTNLQKEVIEQYDGSNARTYIDKDLTINQINKGLENWEGSEGVSSVVLTKNMGASSRKVGSNVYLDVTDKKLGANIGESTSKAINNKDNSQLVRTVTNDVKSRMIKLDDKSANKLADIISKHGLSKGLAGTKENVLNTIKTLRDSDVKDYEINNMFFSELGSVLFHPSKSVRNRTLKILGEETRQEFMGLLTNQKLAKELKNKKDNFVLPNYIRASQPQYARQITELSDVLSKIGNTILTKQEKFDEVGKLRNFLDNNNLDEVEGMFETYGLTSHKNSESFLKEVVEGNFKSYDKYIKEVERFRQIDVDNVDKLEGASKKLYETVTNVLKDIGLEEGVYKQVSAILEKHYTYLPHMLNKQLVENKEAKSVFDKLLGKNKFSDGVKNKYANTRKYKENIDELNELFKTNPDLKRLGINKLMEDDLEQIVYKRILDSTSTIFDTKAKKMIVDTYGVRVPRGADYKKMSSQSIEKFAKSLGVKKPSYKALEDMRYKFKAINEERVKNGLKPLEKFEEEKLGKWTTRQGWIDAINEEVSRRISTGEYELVKMNERTEKTSMFGLSKEKFKQGTEKTTSKRINDLLNITDEAGTDVEDVRRMVEVLEGGEVPEGFVRVNKGDLEDVEIQKLINDGYTLMPREAIKKFEDVSKKMFKDDKNAFLNAYDKVMSVFKASALLSTTFHGNNIIGNTLNSYAELGMEAFNPKRIAQTIQIQRGKNGTIKNGMTYQEVLKKFADLGGVDNNRMMMYQEKWGTLKDKKVASKFDRWNPFKTDEKTGFLAYKVSGKVGQEIEDNARLVNFVYWLEKGKSPDEAMDFVNKALFDYNELTNFEKGTMKRLVPFYTFLRKNIAKQTEDFANNPKTFRLVDRMEKAGDRNSSEEDKKHRPSYLQNGISLGGTSVLNVEAPSNVMKDIANPMTYLGAVSPIIKAPIESALNYKIYNGSKVSEFGDKGDYAKHIMESILPTTQDVGKLKKILSGNDVEKERAIESLRSKWLFDKVADYDMDEAEKASMDRYSKQLNNQYWKLIRENPELKELEKKIKEEEAMKRKQKSYKSPLEGLYKSMF